MPADQFNPPPDQRQLHEILVKIVSYQHSLPDGRAVELDELRRERVLSPADLEFLTSHSVTYKPHGLSDHHGLDMLHMPTEGGGCVFLGPRGPEPVERTASVGALERIIESFLKLPRPKEELSLCIEFTGQDYLGVSPGMFGFGFRSPEWRERLPAIRSVAAEFGLETFQDADVRGNWTLTFRSGPDPSRAAAAAIALLLRGCGLTGDTEVTYSAGALDETDGTERPRQASSPKLMNVLAAAPLRLLLPWLADPDPHGQSAGITLSHRFVLLFALCSPALCHLIPHLPATLFGTTQIYSGIFPPAEVRHPFDHRLHHLPRLCASLLPDYLISRSGQLVAPTLASRTDRACAGRFDAVCRGSVARSFFCIPPPFSG
jgi:hypothetical protein